MINGAIIVVNAIVVGSMWYYFRRGCNFVNVLSKTELDDPAESSKLRASVGLVVGKRRIVKA